EWQAETFKNVGTLAFSPNGKWLVSNGTDTILWETATGKVVRAFLHPPEAMGALAFSADGTILAAGSIQGVIRLWDAHTGEDRGRLEGHSKYIDQLAFTPDGTILASVSHDGSVRLWDPQARTELANVQVDFGVSLALSRDGRSLAAGGVG